MVLQHIIEDGETLDIQVNREELKKKKDKAKLLVVVTNLPGSAVQILTRYLRRGEVERAFHYLKTPLETRPVYHWKERRIHSHFFLVMLGYLQLTTLRVYLKQNYQLSLTLDQLLEDLRFAMCTSLELKDDVFMNYSGKQVQWISQLINDWDLPFKREKTVLPSKR